MWSDPITYPLLRDFALHHRSNPTQGEEILESCKNKTIRGTYK